MKRRSIKRFYVALSVDFGHIIFFLSFYIFHSAKIFDKPSTRDYNLFPSPLLQISDTFGQCVFSGRQKKLYRLDRESERKDIWIESGQWCINWYTIELKRESGRYQVSERLKNDPRQVNKKREEHTNTQSYKKLYRSISRSK